MRVSTAGKLSASSSSNWHVVLARYQSRRLREDVEGFIEGRMGLTINREKTRVVKLKEEGAKLDFLGFSFRYDRDLYGGKQRYLNLTPSAKSLAREKERIRELTDHRHSFQPLPEMIEEINWQTAGTKATTASSSGLAGGRCNLCVPQGESSQESRMREIRTSGLKRGEAINPPLLY